MLYLNRLNVVSFASRPMCFIQSLALALLLVTAPVQATSDRGKMAGVMAAIQLLLDSTEPPIPRPQGRSVKLGLNGLANQDYSVNNNEDFFVEFDLQRQSTELCFNLSANRSFSTGNVTLELNGKPVSVRLGENCFKVNVSQQREINYLVLKVNVPGLQLSVSTAELQSVNQSQLTLSRLLRSEWNDRAVRKVLKIFAFGGHATDSQIRVWADMRPTDAIQEMLNFSEHNLKLSPLAPGEKYTEVASAHGKFGDFLEYIGSGSSNIPIPVDNRDALGINGYRFDSTFNRMVVMRGLNPFRQRIGFWETNYHLAVNLDADVSRRQMVRYYDDIMEAHEARLPYHRVISVAAKSAAAAMQYGHRRNRWIIRDGEVICECNQDLAREIHQLYYGIFGVNDPNHEDVTIPETAKMLTNMRVEYIDIEGFGFSTEVDFNYSPGYGNEPDGSYHHKGDVNILGRTISGVNASVKIDNLMPISILHPESLANLPVMIIEGLADNNLNESRKNSLRRAWAAMGPNKNFLAFIHAYALSDMFHSSQQLKYMTSFERAYYVANKSNIDNLEAFLSNDYVSGGGVAGREIEDVMRGDNASEAFRPLHNVFGGQTAAEAADSAVAFEKNYNRSATQQSYQFRNSMSVVCEGCDQGSAWEKDWSKVIPRPGSGYTANYVAAWLWRHVFGSLDHYSSLERAHLLSILGSDRELSDRNYQLDDQFVYYDLNSLLCMRDDRLQDGENNNSLTTLMSFDSWRRYCRLGDDGYEDYSPVEVAAFNRVFNGADLANSQSDPFPYLRGLIEELAVQQIEFDSTNDITRRRANERVQAALAFMFATPFIFAEGDNNE